MSNRDDLDLVKRLREAAGNDDLYGIEAALLDEAADALERRWVPIESAPKDGTWILLGGGECSDDEGDSTGRVVSGQYTNYLNGGTCEWHWQFCWYDGGYYGVYENPTHWMPLPSPPAKREG